MTYSLNSFIPHLTAKQWLWVLFFVILFIAIAMNCADAASSTSSANEAPSLGLNDAQNQFKDKMHDLVSTFQNAAKNLFLSLALIGIVWSFGQMALKGTELNNLIFELLKCCMTVGFFWWLITEAGDVIFNLFSNFSNWGAKQTGFNPSNPAELINKGTDIALELIHPEGSAFNMTLLLTSLIGAVFGIFIIINCALLAINLIILEIEFYFTCYIGIFALGMAGSSWTKDTSIQYLKKLLAYSVQYFTACLLAGIGFDVLNGLTGDLGAAMDKDELGEQLLAYLNVLVVFLIITKVQSSLPQALSGLFGQGSSAGYDVGGIAGRVAGATAGAVGGVAGKMLAAAGGAGAMSLAKSMGSGIAKSGFGQKAGAMMKSAGNSIAQGYKNSGFSQSMTGKAFNATAGAAGKASAAAGKAMAQSLRNSFTPGGAGVTAQRAGNSAMSDMADTVRKMGEKMGVDK